MSALSVRSQPEYKYKGGSAKNENLHGGLNRKLTHEGGGLRSPGLMHKFIALQVHEHNFLQDVRLGRRQHHEVGHMWRQAALNVQVGAGLVASQPFADSPAKIPELRRQEAQGWDYYKELKGGQHFEKLSEVRADD